MKAIVQRDFEFGDKKFKAGEQYDIKEIDGRSIEQQGVYVDGKWFCDVGSPLYLENFLPDEVDENKVVYLIKQACEHLLDAELLEENGWDKEDRDILLKVLSDDFTVTFSN